MILQIENLGVIKQMNIDLSKDFILFCGPNSTGKTYASYVLFAFLSFNSIKPLSCFDIISDEIQDKGEFVLKREHIESWLAKNCEEVTSQLGSVFGISEDTRIKLFNRLKLSCIYTDEDYQKTIALPIDYTFNDGTVILKVTKEASSNLIRVENNVDNHIKYSSSSLRTVSLLNNLLNDLAFASKGAARMLTVERNSIYTFKTELSLSRNELIDRIQQNSIQSELDLLDIVNSSSRRYPLAVRSSLRVANDLETIQKGTSEYADIAAEIEHDLLKGEVSMTKGGDVEFHSDNMPKTRRLPFHLSSSIVKTMASLVVYLRHLAHNGDTLIVDEPEMNFHPDVQILLARIFSKLSNKGLRVVISTHSDYVIREINNMIMCGALYKRNLKDKVDDIGYEEDSILYKDNVDVIFFNHKLKYVITKSLDIQDTGFDVVTIDETILKQNQRAEWLFDCLEEQNK